MTCGNGKARGGRENKGKMVYECPTEYRPLALPWTYVLPSLPCLLLKKMDIFGTKDSLSLVFRLFKIKKCRHGIKDYEQRPTHELYDSQTSTKQTRKGRDRLFKAKHAKQAKGVCALANLLSS